MKLLFYKYFKKYFKTRLGNNFIYVCINVCNK